jgi:hypothetical protein
VLTFAIISVAVVGLIVGLFHLLQHFSDKTYKPSLDDIRRNIQATIDETIDVARFDEFSCVRIAYDVRLEAIRHRYNEIVNSESYLPATNERRAVSPLNEAGKIELRKLLSELNKDAGQ